MINRHWAQMLWVLSLCFLFFSPVRADEDFETYERSTEIGRKMFFDRYSEEGATIRTAVLLRYCGHDGLAKAVEAKRSDRAFEGALEKLIDQGAFRGLQNWSFLVAQTTANGLITGYELGYQEAVKILLDNSPSQKPACEVAIKLANKILK